MTIFERDLINIGSGSRICNSVELVARRRPESQGIKIVYREIKGRWQKCRGIEDDSRR